MTFRVGQKVVCVNAGAIDGVPGTDWEWCPGEAPVEGRIYTIHSTFKFKASGLVRLLEVRRHVNAIRSWGHDGYNVLRFRPLVERKTDISIFTKMLGPKIRERA